MPIDEEAVVWSRAREQRAGLPLVVFMHGFRGNESDWSEWFPELPARAVGASLRGPTQVRDRWAWVDFERPGMTVADLVAELSAAARGVQAWISRQEADRVALVGFSQGGAMAVQLVRQQPARYESAAVVAGFVADVRPHSGVRTRRPPIWYGSGGRDSVISPAMVRRSRRWLAEHAAATIEEYPHDGHSMSATLVRPALEFTAAALSTTPGNQAPDGRGPRGSAT